MYPDPIHWEPLEAGAEASAAPAAVTSVPAAAEAGPSASNGYLSREAWRRFLAAHVQPLPNAD